MRMLYIILNAARRREALCLAAPASKSSREEKEQNRGEEVDDKGYNFSLGHRIEAIALPGTE